ncbi:hypothetical protein BC828DRAFT_409784 [Blastocladiella britannica]|nr:hypothetical protein BC828DRAFT_409784 [Blastocladiella britannica]
MLLLPKFHPELNPIKCIWSAVKAYTWKHCQYSLAGLHIVLPMANASVSAATVCQDFWKAD